MPKGPKGQKRPADVIGATVMVAKIATGEITDTPEDERKDKAAQMGGTHSEATGDFHPGGGNGLSTRLYGQSGHRF
jgi:hypothetical protein